MKAQAVLFLLLISIALLSFPRYSEAQTSSNPVIVTKYHFVRSFFNGPPTTSNFDATVNVHNATEKQKGDVAYFLSTFSSSGTVGASFLSVNTTGTVADIFFSDMACGDGSTIPHVFEAGYANVTGANGVRFTEHIGGIASGGSLTMNAVIYVVANIKINDTLFGSTSCNRTGASSAIQITPSMDICDRPSFIAAIRNTGSGVGSKYTQFFQTEYSFTDGCPSSAPFGTGTNWYEFAFGSINLLPVTLVIPCNAFQLQCWWYPLFFEGIYSGFVVMLAVIGQARGKALVFMVLTGLTFGSMIIVMMGMTNVMIPLLLLLLSIAYSVKWGNS